MTGLTEGVDPGRTVAALCCMTGVIWRKIEVSYFLWQIFNLDHSQNVCYSWNDVFIPTATRMFNSISANVGLILQINWQGLAANCVKSWCFVKTFVEEQINQEQTTLSYSHLQVLNRAFKTLSSFNFTLHYEESAEW